MVEITNTLSTFFLLLLLPLLLLPLLLPFPSSSSSSSSSCRGQVMNAEMLSNVVDVELISEGVKYSLKVQKNS